MDGYEQFHDHNLRSNNLVPDSQNNASAVSVV